MDMPSSGMQRLFQLVGRTRSLTDSTVQNAVQHSVLEHEEHNNNSARMKL